MIAIALLGMPGAGKSTASRHLATTGIPIFRFGRLVVDEVMRRGLDVTPEAEATVRMELRKQRGEAFMAEAALDWAQAHSDEPVVGLDGVYSLAEYDLLRKRLLDRFVPIAILADRAIRYERLAARSERGVDAAQAEWRERHEIEHLHKAEALAMADRFILNNGDEASFLDQVVRVCDQQLAFVEDAGSGLLDLHRDRLLALVSTRESFDAWDLSLVMHRGVVDESGFCAWHACELIGRLGAVRGVPFLQWVAERPDVEFDSSSLHRIAARAMAAVPHGWSEYLLALLREGADDQKALAADALGETRAASASEELAACVREGDWNVALWAALSLAKLGPSASPQLRALAVAADWPRRYLAFDALARIDPSGARAVLAELEPGMPPEESEALQRRLYAFP